MRNVYAGCRHFCQPAIRRLAGMSTPSAFPSWPTSLRDRAPPPHCLLRSLPTTTHIPALRTCMCAVIAGRVAGTDKRCGWQHSRWPTSGRCTCSTWRWRRGVCNTARHGCRAASGRILSLPSPAAAHPWLTVGRVCQHLCWTGWVGDFVLYCVVDYRDLRSSPLHRCTRVRTMLTKRSARPTLSTYSYPCPQTTAVYCAGAIVGGVCWL